MSDYAKQPRRKYCQFCKEDAEYIDYKDTQMLRTRDGSDALRGSRN